MSHNVENHKHLAMQNVSVAVGLDAAGHSLEAYKKYLECIELMSSRLLRDALELTALQATDTLRKYIALCKQCIDRVDDLIKTAPLPTAGSDQQTPSFAINRPTSISAVASSTTLSFPSKYVDADAPPKYLESTTTLPPQYLETATSFHLPPAYLDLLQSGSPPQYPETPHESVCKVLSPVEMAKLQNRHLLEMHKTRLQRLPHSGHATTNLSLSLQRRLMENMAIAKQRQQLLEKKKEERLKVLMEETDRRFSCRTGMSPDELARRKLYTEILEYEQDEKWLMELRRKVSDKYKDDAFVIDSVSAILNASDHPLTRLLKGYQYNIYQRVSNAMHQASSSSDEIGSASSPSCSVSNGNGSGRVVVVTASKSVLEQQIGALVAEVQGCLEKLETMFVVTYEEFDDVEVRGVLRDSLDEIFFQPIWPLILSLFRHSILQKETTMTDVMETHRNVSPVDIGVPEKFSLCSSKSATSPLSPSTIPYLDVIECLKSIPQMASPSKKLETIVKSSQLICQSIEEFYTRSSNSTTPPQMGADEMLPILSYVIVKTEQPILVAECYALMEFIDERCLIAEQGYCLTSLLTAIDFLLTLSPKSLPTDGGRQ